MSRKKVGTKRNGSVRIQVYIGKENGKRKYKSFTASTKAEAQALANEWKVNHEYNENGSMTVLECLERYVAMKESVLSPSTVKGYNRMIRNQVEGHPICSMKADDLTNTIVQRWISDMSVKIGPKTIANAYGLFSSAMTMFDIGPFRVTLPQRIKPELYCPSSEDVTELIRLMKEKKDQELLICILLAAFGPLRRSEACALTNKDIKGNIVSVNKAMIQNDDGAWVVKAPKTYGSYRDIEFPDFVIKEMEGIEGQIIRSTPDAISERFARFVKRTGLPYMRFHDLRHYSASILHAIGVPDVYILHRGGWSSDNVMKAVYRNNITNEELKQTKKIVNYFGNFE